MANRSDLGQCPTATVCHVASFLDLRSHTRFAVAAHWYAGVCAQPMASPIEIALRPPAILPDISARATVPSTATSYGVDSAHAMRHYRPQRLTCLADPKAGLHVDFLHAQTQLRELTLLAHGASRAADMGTMEWLACMTALESLSTNAACWRDDAGRRLLATATGLTELRLSDYSVEDGDIFDVGDVSRETTRSSTDGLAAMAWAAALTALENLEVRYAPLLRSFRGLGGGGGGDMLRHTRLQSLYVGGVERNCDVASLESATGLRHLTLDARWSHVRFSGLERLPAASLLRLDLYGTVLDTFESLRHLTSLTRLNVACDQAVRSLAHLGGMQRMRDLTVRGMPAMRSLADLVRMTRLERLSLDAGSRAALTPLAGLPRLRVLVLVNGWRIYRTSKSCPPLPQLARLEVHGSGDRYTQTAVLCLMSTPLMPNALAAMSGNAIVVRDSPSSAPHACSAMRYADALGPPTHSLHQHALRRTRRPSNSGADLRSARSGSGSSASASAETSGADTDIGADTVMCERCARDILAEGDVWTCGSCEFGICSRCAAATTMRH